MVINSNHLKKLKDLGINIKSIYIVNGKLLERNTDNTKNDNIVDGVLYEKEYIKDEKTIHKETDFDTRIEYTYNTDLDNNSDYTCPNCGVKGKVKEFVDGCPYCKTNYNIDFKDKELGNKNTYDSVLKSNTYRIITLIIDIIISMILSYLFIKNTSRTFNGFDITKVIILGVTMSLFLYYVFYTLDAYVVLGPIKRYKARKNKEQELFWKNNNLDKKKFYNNLIFEIDKIYSSNKDLIDYDIIDYDNFKEYKKDNIQYIEITMYTKVIYYINNKIKTKILNKKFKLKNNNKNIIELKDGINIIKCPNCGSNINVLDHKCNYCNTEIGYLGEWELVE